MKRYILRKSFGEWSSGTEVYLLSKDKTGYAIVRHTATGRQFQIPTDYLVEKRNRERA